MTPIDYAETESFQKDFKRLKKKFRTLEEDLANVKQHAIELYHLQGIDSRGIFQIPGFCTETIKIFKIKKFACKALKGKGAQSGIRIIYAFHPNTGKIDFIEMYFKGEQENEDRSRIENYLKNSKF